MSYKVIPEIPRAERTYWTPERGGRTWQVVGGKRVHKFSYSPFTAKAYQEYTFYADVEMEIEVEYEAKDPSKASKKFKKFTVPAYVGTYLQFRDAALSGEVMERLSSMVDIYGGGSVLNVGFWRNRGMKSED